MSDADASSALEPKRNSYGSILRSSAIVGGSSAVNMLIGLVRTKIMAVLLGPSGFGLMGALNSIADLARTLAGVGIHSGGVRQIAAAMGTGDAARIAITAHVLRRVALVLGIAGGLLLAAIALPVARATFGRDDLGWAVAILGVAVLFRLVSDGQGALLQGMRRIGDLARINVLGAFGGSVAGVTLVLLFGERGVAPAVVAIAAATLAASYWYARRIPLTSVPVGTTDFANEARGLLQVGVAFMTSGLLTMGAAYAVRLVLIRSEGLAGAGLFQAAWAIGGLYVTFVLQAMGTDFYPRLVATAENDREGNALVNEQAMVSMLLAAAGVIGTLTLAPWVIALLYSAEFAASTETLRWVCLGMALRVVTWPLGYILVAKGRQAYFVTADLIWAVANVALTLQCVRWFGLAGAGIAFFLSYVLHLAVVYPMCRHVSGFRWTGATLYAAAAFVVAVGSVHAGFLLLAPKTALWFGIGMMALTTVVSIAALRHLVAPARIPRRIAWIASSKAAES